METTATSQEETYTALVQSAIEDAAGIVSEQLQLTSPIDPDDPETTLRFRALVYDQAGNMLVGQWKSLVQAIVHIMYEMEREGYYRMLPQEFESLREWARFRFDRLVEQEVMSWDYVARFVTTVTDLLIPLSKEPVIDTDTGEVLADVDQVIENATQSSLAQMSFYYAHADPETKQQIATAMARGSGVRVMEELKQTVRKQIKHRAAGEDGDQEDDQMEILVEHLADGRIRFSAVVSESELLFIEGLLGGRARFVLARAS